MSKLLLVNLSNFLPPLPVPNYLHDDHKCLHPDRVAYPKCLGKKPGKETKQTFIANSFYVLMTFTDSLSILSASLKGSVISPILQLKKLKLRNVMDSAQ